MRLGVLCLIVLATSPVCADVDVSVAGDRVSLRAVSAPVSEILDRLASQTGMRLTYDAPRPRQALTATLENRRPAEAILSVLEGLGLNYALVMDRSGARVEQLLILGTVSAAVAPAAPVQPAPPPQARKPLSPAEQEAIWGDDADADDAPADEAAEGEEAEQPGAQEGATKPPRTGAAPIAGPRPPEYPSSAFSPRLPMPTPVPSPSTPERQ